MKANFVGKKSGRNIAREKKNIFIKKMLTGSTGSACVLCLSIEAELSGFF